ncbi:TM2 domain-containing protein [Devosia sp. MC521]|uniref:TM2 domain-containing protein n=2 Tax=Devosia TaxID=46913 RepID=UPI0020BF12C5|nr:TM2 domain-containing protein [Devosia sp. MC521]
MNDIAITHGSFVALSRNKVKRGSVDTLVFWWFHHHIRRNFLGEKMTQDRAYAQYDIEKKSPIIAYVLWFFLGYIGVHRFYLGRVVSGFIMLAMSALFALLTFVSFGLFAFLWFIMGAWWLIDALLIPGMISRRNNEVANRVLGRRY